MMITKWELINFIRLGNCLRINFIGEFIIRACAKYSPQRANCARTQIQMRALTQTQHNSRLCACAFIIRPYCARRRAMLAWLVIFNGTPCAKCACILRKHSCALFHQSAPASTLQSGYFQAVFACFEHTHSNNCIDQAVIWTAAAARNADIYFQHKPYI